MTKYTDSKALANLTLGKQTEYASEYNPELLQAVPRSLNRDELSIAENNLPFLGEDVWYGYELSWLNLKGKPVVAVAEFRFPCTSTNIVESKSFKLYLNSLNQSKFESLAVVKSHLSEDLSNLTKSSVSVELFPVEECNALKIQQSSASCLDDIDIEIDSFQFSPELLKSSTSEENVEEQLVSHLLKSNCLITNQPDWATIYINYKGRKIDRESLLRYLISFRQHNEFHEQCVERIFCDIQNFCLPTELTVYARYTRRGGLDINPYRTTTSLRAPDARTFRQ